MSCAYCLENNLCDVCMKNDWATHCDCCELHICHECEYNDNSICKRCYSLDKCDICNSPNFLYFCKCGYAYCISCSDFCINCLTQNLNNSKL
jgi:hypothetical protein